MPTTPLNVPDEIALAVRAEALRQHRRPGEVLVDFIRRCWPDYVGDRLGHDLKSHVIDVTATTTLPAGTDGVEHLNALPTQATRILPAGDLIEEGPPGHGQPD